jgi:hypothetical protein
MRETDLLEDNYTDNLRAEVMTLLAMVSARGINKINTQNLLNDLEEQGFAIDADSLLLLLDNMDIVSQAAEDTITLSTSNADAMVGMDTDKIEADRVDALATNQAKKGIGEDDHAAELKNTAWEPYSPDEGVVDPTSIRYATRSALERLGKLAGLNRE